MERAINCPPYVDAKEKARAKRLMDNYKLTIAQYDKIFAYQGGVCYICGQPEPVKGRRLSVDHDHDTGEIRGLLCSCCNPIIGKIERAFVRYGLRKRGVSFADFLYNLGYYFLGGSRSVVSGWVVERALGHRHFGYKGHVGTKAHRALIKRLKRKGPLTVHPLQGAKQ